MAQDLLVTLTDMKTYLGEGTTTYDTFLTDRLTVASAAVEGYCARKFTQKTYLQTFYRKDFKTAPKKLSLFHYPVTEITEIQEDGDNITEYRLQKERGLIISDSLFMSITDVLTVKFKGGYLYADIPTIVKQTVKNIVKQDYDKKINGLDIDVGKDIQRISMVGVISFDFDYSKSMSERDEAFGEIIGSNANLLDVFRTERTISAGQNYFVEEVV